MEIILNRERVCLLPQRGIFLPEYNTLILADLHFGKINHFRMAGIPVPSKANNINYEVLINLINQLKPQRILFLGDLFHSHYNNEWEVLGQIIKHFSSLKFELIVGNHDIMSDYQYQRHRIIIHPKSLMQGSLIFTHEPLEAIPDGFYNLSGHLHPGIQLRGSGKQRITLPCFYFGTNQGFLPAFGSFTGLAHINPKKEDRIFVIADNNIIAYPNV